MMNEIIIVSHFALYKLHEAYMKQVFFISKTYEITVENTYIVQTNQLFSVKNHCCYGMHIPIPATHSKQFLLCFLFIKWSQLFLFKWKVK